MFDAMMDWLGYLPYFYWHRGHVPGRLGTRHHLLTPYGPYTTADGKAVNIAVLSQEHWHGFCTYVVDRPEWLADARFATNEARMANRQDLEELVATEFRQRTRWEWIQRLRRAGIPFGVVRDLPEVLSHPRLQHTGQVVKVPSPVGLLPCMDNPVHWSDLKNRLDAIPGLGEHTERILAELGFTAAEVRSLRASGVV
jgi:crotonobetainyl-CoA:carnitine CoA-transferase CaiB-like acyl-CoA transferase